MTQYKEKIDQMIINFPFQEPKQHWDFDKTKGKHFIKEGRRPAGYTVFSNAKTHQEFGTFHAFPLVKKIRPRVKKWKDRGYPGVTSITKRLLEFWSKSNADERIEDFFFCQKEAIETLIWFKESHPSERVDIDIPTDGGDFERLCTKMATGTGKTYVMAMLITWQMLNKIANPKDTRFSKHILIVCPNLTVKKRLLVLKPENDDNYYEKKKIVPHNLLADLSQGKILIMNCQALQWEKEDAIKKRRSVDKRGPKSDEAYIRKVLGDMAGSRNILVINDEAHHAWRYKNEETVKQDERDEKERATCWIQGLDRIHKARGILTCFDFSATPLPPSSKGKIFPWIVSDFGLSDAIESGLTKTPVFAVGDDHTSQDEKSKLHHIYNDESVKSNLSKKSEKIQPLPQLVTNGYTLLSQSWEETFNQWQKGKEPILPVMISVVNRKETADRINHFFDKGTIRVAQELCEENKKVIIYSDIDPPKEKRVSRRENLEQKREIINTVGCVGKDGEKITNIISVAMLSEGWNCQTVTHIMGLRAFSSQLLCEQVIGRGLRRTSYDKNKDEGFDQEYVKILGIPYALLPQEEITEGGIPKTISPKWKIFPDSEKEKYKITWPNVERIDFELKPYLTVDFNKVHPLKVADVRTIAELAPEINGQPDYEKIKVIDMKDQIKNKDIRLQTLVFETARNVYDQIDDSWKRKINKDFALCQIFRLVENFLNSNKFQIEPKSFNENEEKRLITIMIAIEQIVESVFSAIQHQNKETIIPIYKDQKYQSTKETPHWWTGRDTHLFKKTHINKCVFDSNYELRHAKELDKNEYVEAWVKNEHLDFEIQYVHEGVLKQYIPDFIVKLADKSHLILEVKGVKQFKDESKWEYMKTWVKAVSQNKENGQWHFKASFDPTGQSVHEIIDRILSASEKHLEQEKQAIEKEEKKTIERKQLKRAIEAKSKNSNKAQDSNEEKSRNDS